MFVARNTFTRTDLVSSVEVCPSNVEAVNVAWNDGTQEQDAIYHAIPPRTIYNHNGQGREEDIDAHYRNAVCKSS